MKLYTKTINNQLVIKNKSQIVIVRDNALIFNPTEEMILSDGWSEFEMQDSTESKKTISELILEIILDLYNSKTDISNEEALERSLIVYSWDKYIGKTLNKGQVISWNNLVYRVILDISVVLENQEPNISTAALYEVIELLPTGTIDDPIPYTPPMEIFKDKFYEEDNIIYLCTRNSEVTLTHRLKDLIGLYVNTY